MVLTRAKLLAVVTWLAMFAVVAGSGCGFAPGNTTPTTAPTLFKLHTVAIPEYPSASLVAATQNDAGQYVTKEYRTREEPQVVKEFYRRELPKYGWQDYAKAYKEGTGHNLAAQALVYAQGTDPSWGLPNAYATAVEVFKAAGDTIIRLSITPPKRMSPRVIGPPAGAGALPIPVYQGSRIVKQEVSADKLEMTEEFSTAADTQLVLDFFRRELSKNGWTDDSTGKAPKPLELWYTICAKPEDRYQLHMTLSNTSAGTSIKIGVYSQPTE